MGIYVISGASTGIGAETRRIPQFQGNEAFNIDYRDGDNVELACLFKDYGILQDFPLLRIGKDPIHLEDKMTIEMM